MRPPILLPLALSFLLVAGCTAPTGETEGPGATGGQSGFALPPSFPNPQPAEVSRLEFVARLNGSDGLPWPTGSGNFVLGDYVFGSALERVFFIADVSDPAHPRLVFNTSADGPTPYARKAEVMAHPDGRRTLVLATQTKGMHFWDVTDPRQPSFKAVLDLQVPNHNIAVVPGTPYVFNAPSTAGGGAVPGTSNGVAKNDLVDASDPANPVSLGRFGIYGCHGITFHGTYGQPKFRAYCAGKDATEIWDLDRLNATAEDFGIRVLGAVGKAQNPAIGAGGLHHLAASNADGTVLLIGDEFSGGRQPGACFAHDPATGLSTPLGALWFYDVRDEANPVLKGHISPPTLSPQSPPPTAGPVPIPPAPVNPLEDTPGAGCTAHFGTLVPGEEKLVIAWYNAGVLLIDFTDPAQPAILDQYRAPGVNTWNARVWNGYVFTGDMGRGMDVLRLA